MRLRAAWLALAVLPNGATALASTPPCVARAELEPATAFVGQQVLWKVQIDSRDDVAEISWVDTPAFANIRTERLPGLPVVPTRAPRRAPRGVPRSDPRRAPEEEPQGEPQDTWLRYTTREEQRALFAERAGALPIATSGLLCKLDTGEMVETPVPSVTLNVLPLPVSGQPEDFPGVVGPLALRTHVEPDRLESGGTLHVTVSIRGSGNLWDIGDPLGRWAPVETDVFARKPQLELRPGKRLSVQKIFRYDVVPRGTGAFTVPPVRLSYFDPVDARYHVARSARIDVAVSPAPDSANRAPEPGSVRRAATRPPDSAPSVVLPVLTLGLVLAAAIATWRWRRRLGSSAAPIATGDTDHDAREMARALRAALASHADASDPPGEGEKAGPADGIRAGDPSGSNPAGKNRRSEFATAATELLETLERSRFDPGTEAPDRAEIERALARLDRGPRRHP